jgi:hypothetical protein
VHHWFNSISTRGRKALIRDDDDDDGDDNDDITTPWSRVLLYKLIVAQLVKKFLAFCGTLRFITMFTRAPHWPLSRDIIIIIIIVIIIIVTTTTTLCIFAIASYKTYSLE